MNWYEVLPGLVLLHAIMATAAVVTAFLSRKPRLGKVGLGLLLAVLTMQTSQLFVTLFFRSQPELLRADYFQGLIWMLAAMSYASWRSARFSSLCLILAPLTLVVTLGTLILGAEQALPVGKVPASFFMIHISCMLASLGLIALAFGASVLFLVQEKAIKSRTPLSGFLRDLPPLSRLDSVNAHASTWGFGIYTLGLVFGMVSARLEWGVLISKDPKELLSLAIWALYAVLFHQRLAKGWQGRKPALLTIAIFAGCLFSLFVINTLLDTHHGLGFRPV